MKSITFPKSGVGQDVRSFQIQWLRRYDWIEYSVSKDAIFCHICRQFGIHQQEPTFTITGYRNWRAALTPNKGLIKHNASSGHIEAALRQQERLKRDESSKSISELQCSSILEKRRYYCKTIIEIIIFLASNRLALRGDWDEEVNTEGGLFNSLFEFVLSRSATGRVPEMFATWYKL